jgi:hypothetical protein
MTIDETRALIKSHLAAGNYLSIFAMGDSLVTSPEATPLDMVVFASACIVKKEHHTALKWFIAVKQHPQSDAQIKETASASIEALKFLLFQNQRT